MPAYDGDRRREMDAHDLNMLYRRQCARAGDDQDHPRCVINIARPRVNASGFLD